MKMTAVAGSCAATCASTHSIWSAPMWPGTLPGTWVSSPTHSESPAVNVNVIALSAFAGNPIGERRAQRGAVLVVPGHEPGPVVPWTQCVAHGLVRDRQIVIGVIPRDDEVVDPPGVLLDVGDHVPEQLTGRDLVETSLRIRVEVQVGQLDDAGQGHRAPVCTNRLPHHSTRGARPWGHRPGGGRRSGSRAAGLSYCRRVNRDLETRAQRPVSASG